MAITSDKQRQALEASGWRLVNDRSGVEAWDHDDMPTYTYVWLGGEIYFGAEHLLPIARLAEFLSIINAKDETVVVEGEVHVSPDRWMAFIGDNGVPDVLEPFDGKRVRFTIGSIDEPKKEDA